MSRCKSWGDSSVFEWLCCVCSQTRLGPGPRQQGRQVQEEGFPTLGTERSAEWRGRSAAEVCTSEARKIGVPLVTRQGRSPSAGLISLHQRKTQRLLLLGSASSGGRCPREGPAEMCSGRRQGQAPTFVSSYDQQRGLNCRVRVVEFATELRDQS